jgi:hypothetical protein
LYSIRKWSAAGINFKWTLFAVTISGMVNASPLSWYQCMVVIPSHSVVLGVLMRSLAESCYCLSYWALENAPSPSKNPLCIVYVIIGFASTHPYCSLITEHVHLLHLSSLWVCCWSVNFSGNLLLEMVYHWTWTTAKCFFFQFCLTDLGQRWDGKGDR